MKGSYFAIERGQLFCLLGPNGAGAYWTLLCAHTELSRMFVTDCHLALRTVLLCDDYQRGDCIHHRVLLLCPDHDDPAHCERSAVIAQERRPRSTALQASCPHQVTLRI